MVTRLDSFISRGSICNTEPGKVTGSIWLIDATEPITLNLAGNPHRDLAGTELFFSHTNSELPPHSEVPKIAPLQTGTVGDITASKKIFFQEHNTGDSIMPDPTLANGLSIEWYDEAGQRFIIESIDFNLSISAAEWQMDTNTEKEQLRANTTRFHDYIDTIARRITDEDEDDPESNDDPPLNEFEWEERLRESDRISEAYAEALDKYQDYPNQEQLVAAAMGWNHLNHQRNEVEWLGENDDLEDEDEDEDEDEKDFDLFNPDEDADPEIWLDSDSDDREDEQHPLYDRAHTFSVRLHREAQDFGLLESDEEPGANSLGPIQTLVFTSMELSAKLAGALNGINMTGDPEPGLVVAWLKRGLPVLGKALGATEDALNQEKAPKEWVEKARQELFELRSAMLDLIQEFRRQLP